jgi:hypothetical protein
MRFTQTPTPSITATPSLTPSITPTQTPTGTVCPGLTPTATRTPTQTATQTGTLPVTPTQTQTQTSTLGATPTMTPTPSITPSSPYDPFDCIEYEIENSTGNEIIWSGLLCSSAEPTGGTIPPFTTIFTTCIIDGTISAPGGIISIIAIC